MSAFSLIREFINFHYILYNLCVKTIFFSFQNWSDNRSNVVYWHDTYRAVSFMRWASVDTCGIVTHLTRYYVSLVSDYLCIFLYIILIYYCCCQYPVIKLDLISIVSECWPTRDVWSMIHFHWWDIGRVISQSQQIYLEVYQYRDKIVLSTGAAGLFIQSSLSRKCYKHQYEKVII
jgi:hypothetical protein